MVVFTLTLVRHGETVANKKGIIQGQQDTPLSEVGERQAQLLGVRFQYERFTHVFASDLSRATKTAQTILDGSKVCKCTVIKDARLRERKYGIVEGKYSKDLKEMAKKANANKLSFNPPGAETTEQVRHRMILFFQELCRLIQQQVADQDSGASAGSTKRRRHGSSNNNPFGATPVVNSSSSMFPVEINMNHEETSTNTAGETSSSRNITLKGSTGTIDCDSISDPFVSESSSRKSHCTSLVDSDFSSSSPYHPDEAYKQQDKELVINTSFHPETTICDEDIKSRITGGHDTQHGCPNVSLSPLVEHRLERISSISSGRNSFDDGDVIPPVIANIILVSHGGCLRELVRYFIEELDCKIPGSMGHALRVSPNTGVSKFTVTFSDTDEKPKVTCLLIHDKDHLMDNEYELDTELAF